ncbi:MULTISPECIES: hypothetical protein [unclassified Bradyrhizobium]|uniref:hypothetical protein n=1 Tax=unclassified Bradyrhizobium TaxID=2631580 RepID=UPI0033984A96
MTVAGVQQWRQRRQFEPHRGIEILTTRTRIDVAIGFAAVHRLELAMRGRKDLADLVMAQRNGGDRGELRGATVVESIGINGAAARSNRAGS